MPRKVFYDFGLETLLRDRFFTDPEWCALRGTGRDLQGDFYQSSEAARLHAAAGTSPAERQVSVWALGLDFLQWWKRRQHSTGLLTLRCEDLPHACRSKLRFTHILAIIPGPSEPANLAPYLEDTLAALQRFAPAGEGCAVVEHVVVDGKVEQRESVHHVLLGAVYGDTPGVRKLALWLGHSAYLGCGYCLLMGVRLEGAVRFLGYLSPVPSAVAIGVTPGAGAAPTPRLQAYCGDPAIQLDHGMQMGRGELVDASKLAVAQAEAEAAEARRQGMQPAPIPDLVDPYGVGCHGVSPLLKALNYLDYQNTFVVPVPHAGLLGVVKDFWAHVLMPQASHQHALSNWAKGVIEGRATHVTATCDFGRVYTCVRNKRGNWTMEDWLHWTETWSVYVTMPENGMAVLPPVVADMWQKLRSGLLYFCRVRPLQDCAQTVQAAAAQLRAYACLVQQHFGPKMCKFNLHVLVCRLLAQELARGKAAFGNEYWVENLIQWAKGVVSNRTTKYPELVLVSEILQDEGLARARRQHFGHVQSFEELHPPTSLPSTASVTDEGAADGTVLRGSGRLLTSAMRARWGMLVEALNERVRRGLDVPGWHAADFATASCVQYTSAEVRGGEVVHSTSYLRARSRQSFYVLLTLTEGDPARVVEYMARVLFFVKLSAATKPEARLAVCELFRVDPQAGAVGTLWHAKRFLGQRACMFAASLTQEEMQQKHVLAHPTSSTSAWFIPYCNMSGTAASRASAN